MIVEGAYGHSVMTRQVVTQVLCDKIEAGFYAEEEALTFGRMILRENAKVLFSL